MTTSTIKIQAIISTVDTLIDARIPGFSWTNEFESTKTGHWFMTKAQMESTLERRLTDAETTCLSLTRAFGPTPILNDEEREELFAGLNKEGEWIEWDNFKSQLESWGEWVITMDTGGFTDVMKVSQSTPLNMIEEILEEGNQHSYTKKGVYEIFTGSWEAAHNRSCDIQYEEAPSDDEVKEIMTRKVTSDEVKKILIDGDWVPCPVLVVSTETLTNEEGVGYGTLYKIKPVPGVPNHIVYSLAREELADDNNDVWNQSRFQII